MKKVAIVTLICMTMFNMTGCTKAEKYDTSEAENSKITVLTLYNEDGNFDGEFPDNPVLKKIEQKTGVRIKFELPVGDSSQYVDLMVASGEYPDLVNAKGNQQKLISAGALLNLKEYINKYGQNIKRFYGDDLIKFKGGTDIEGIFYLACYGREETRLAPRVGFQLQHQVVKELGYPKLTTLKDYETAIKAYKEKHPTVDGQPTVGLSLIADDWRWMVSVGNSASNAIGLPDDGQWYIDNKTKKATFKFMLPEIKEYFKWLNHMNDIDLLDPDSFVQKYDQYKEKIESGRVLALSDALWEYNEAEKVLVAEKKYDKTYGMYPLVIDSKYKFSDFRETPENIDYGIGISKSCEDPEKALKFLDWICSDEAQVLINWGVEGINYNIVNGKRVVPDEEWIKRNEDSDYVKRTGIGMFGYPFPQWAAGKKDSTGQFYNPVTEDTITKNYNPEEKETLKAYGKSIWKDFYPQKDQLPKSDWGDAWQINIPQNSELSVIYNKCNSIMKEEIPRAVLSKPSEFDGVWEDIIKKLKEAGVDQANIDFTQLVEERIKQQATGIN
jgi:putative aldouronate transport system substrate-binding protein